MRTENYPAETEVPSLGPRLHNIQRHEARPLRHQRQRLGLFLRLRLDNVNLDHRLLLCLWHQNLHCLNELKGVRQPRSYWSRGLLSFLDSYRDLSEYYLLQSEESESALAWLFFASFVNLEVPLRSSLFESFFYPSMNQRVID
jgi:hypothetical protein